MDRWDQAATRPRRASAGTGWDSAVHAMCQRRRLSPASIATARALLCGSRLTLFRRERGIESPTDMTGAAVRAFLDGVSGQLAPSSVRKISQQLRWLSQWTAEEFGTDPMADGGLHGWKAPAQTFDFDAEEPLTHEEVDRLAREAGNLRDRAIVLMLATTGMRPSELVALDVVSIRLDRRPPRCEIRQGRREGLAKTAAGVRVVPLETGGTSIVRPIREYLSWRSTQPTGSAALFLSERKTASGERRRLTQDGVKRVLDRLGRRCEIHCNPYRFRHSVCSWLADAGLPEHALMTLMGWADRSMVDRYYRRRPEVVLELASRIQW